MTLLLYISIFVLCLLSKALFDKYWIKKHGTLGVIPKVIATSVCMIIIGISTVLTFHFDEKWRYIVLFFFLSMFWSLIFDPLIAVFLGHKPTYLSENTWPDKMILKYFNNVYLYTFFRLVVIGFLWGMINDFELKKKK